MEEEQGRRITGGWWEFVRCGTSAFAPNTLDVGGISWRKNEVEFMPNPRPWLTMRHQAAASEQR